MGMVAVGSVEAGRKAEEGREASSVLLSGTSYLADGRPRALVLRAPGINCDRETALACQAAGAAAEIVALRDLAGRPERLFDYGLLVLPGGFSHGDYLGAGTLLAAELRVGLWPVLARFVGEGRLILGICN